MSRLEGYLVYIPYRHQRTAANFASPHSPPCPNQRGRPMCGLAPGIPGNRQTNWSITSAFGTWCKRRPESSLGPISLRIQNGILGPIDAEVRLLDPGSQGNFHFAVTPEVSVR